MKRRLASRLRPDSQGELTALPQTPYVHSRKRFVDREDNVGNGQKRRRIKNREEGSSPYQFLDPPLLF